MDLGAALVADAQAAEGMQMGKTALHHPALAPQAGAVRDAATGDQWPDAAPAQETTVPVVVVATVGQQAVGLATRPAALSFDGPGVQRLQKRQQLGYVIAVAASQRDRQGDARSIDQEVVLRASCGHDRPGMARSGAPQKGAYVRAVDGGSRPIDCPGGVEAHEQALMEGLPDAGPLLITQPSPAGHPRAVAVFLGQILPGDPRVQHVEDAV